MGPGGPGLGCKYMVLFQYYLIYTGKRSLKNLKKGLQMAKKELYKAQQNGTIRKWAAVKTVLRP